jgi:uncharacterized protein (DUF1015 family)
MRKRALTPFGLLVKTKLLAIDQTQEWLIEQAKVQTGMYVDSSNLYKLMTGQLRSQRLKEAIIEILQLKS